MSRNSLEVLLHYVRQETTLVKPLGIGIFRYVGAPVTSDFVVSDPLRKGLGTSISSLRGHTLYGRKASYKVKRQLIAVIKSFFGEID